MTAVLARPAERRRARHRTGFPWLPLPATVWVMAVFAVPTVILLASSFLTYDGVRVGGSVTAENYAALFRDAYFWSVFLDTLWISAVVGVLCTAGGLLLAHFIVRSGSRWRSLVLLVVVSPLVSSVVVRTYGWLVLLQDDGLFNQVLLWTGTIRDPIAFIGSRGGVIAGLVHVLLPFAVFTAMSSVQSVDPVLERASRDLGAGAVRTFFQVTLPLIRPGLISGFMLTFAISLGAYATAAVLGGGRVQTLATLVRDRMVVSLEWGQAAAIAAVLLVVSVATVLALLWAGQRSRTEV